MSINYYTTIHGIFARLQYRVGISIEKKYYYFLILLSRNRFSNDKNKTLAYLLQKYIPSLYRISIVKQKQTYTVKYQPVTKRYSRYSIKLDPLLWGKLHELRNSLGYSISFLIRIMLEWEMEEHDSLPAPCIKKPNNYVPFSSTPESSAFSTFVLKSYVAVMETDFTNRIIEIQLKTEFS